MKRNSAKPVDELINIVNGGNFIQPIYHRKHWYSIFKTCIAEGRWEYNLEDQLSAIEALGCSKSQEALEFLHFLLKENHFRKQTGWTMQGSDAYDNIEIGCEFPNALGDLASELKYFVYTGSVQNEPSVWELDYQEAALRKRGHSVIQRAIERLISDLRSANSCSD